MKKVFTILVAMFTIMSAGAQSNRYMSAMQAGLNAMDSSFKDPANLLSLSNRFERIAIAEKEQWLPYYYAAFLQVNYAFRLEDKTKTDVVIDKAEALLQKADSLSPLNSEISCLKSMIASSRLMVDPMSRYMIYGPVSAREIDKAIAQDPSNPRPHLLRGQGLKYTPEQFGGGCANALIHLETAKEKFTTFKPQSEIAPMWGMEMTSSLIDDCKK